MTEADRASRYTPSHPLKSTHLYLCLFKKSSRSLHLYIKKLLLSSLNRDYF